jgi:hypothetical protein
LFTYAPEKSSKPPTQVTRALSSRVWKPVTIPNALPAQSPSPARSAASNRTSAPESVLVSDAKLSAGAWKMGTNRRLLPCAKGIPENHMGGCWVLVRDAVMAPIRGSRSEGYPAQGNEK